MDKTIYCIGNNLYANHFLKSSLSNTDSLRKWKNTSQLNRISNLLIISPQKITLGGTFYSWVDVSCLWEHYLLEHYPHIKLMIVGFWDCDLINYENYRDILELKNWQEDFFSSSFPTIKEVYLRKEIEESRLNEWDIKQYLKRFADGHDQQGFFKYLIALKHTMTIAYDEYNAPKDEYKLGYEVIEKEIISVSGIEEWKHLSERWTFYKPFLEHTHFQQYLEEIKDSIEKMQSYFDNLLEKPKKLADNEQLFASGNFEQQLQNIEDLLRRYLTPYL